MVSFFMSLYIMFNPQNYDSLVESHVYVAERSKFDNGFQKERYEILIKKLHEVYDPIIKAEGGVFQTLTDWTDGAVNMWAFRLGNEYWLEIPGGMARYHLINEEAFLTSLCHELGHLLGGEPKKGNISLEGQSDYFATYDCIDQLLSEIDQEKLLMEESEINSICIMEQKGDVEFCQRAMAGAKSLTSYYAELEKVSFPQLSTPSAVKVSSTLTRHPPAQCRLDTLKAGYFGEPRPRCWFKP